MAIWVSSANECTYGHAIMKAAKDPKLIPVVIANNSLFTLQLSSSKLCRLTCKIVQYQSVFEFF